MTLRIHTARFVRSADINDHLGIPEHAFIGKGSYGDAEGTLLNPDHFAYSLEPWVECDGISQEDVLAIIPEVEGLMTTLEARTGPGGWVANAVLHPTRYATGGLASVSKPLSGQQVVHRGVTV